MAHTLQLHILPQGELSAIDGEETGEKANQLLADAALIIPNLTNTLEICGESVSYNRDETQIASNSINTDFALAELTHDHAHLALSTLMQAEYANDDLAFLFTQTNTFPSNSSLSLKKQTNITSLLSTNSSDPLSLLNQHFQPPEANTNSNPITITQPTEYLADNILASHEGNILRDLGFFSENAFTGKSEMYLNTLPSQIQTTFSYRQDNAELEFLLERNLPMKISKKPLTRFNIKSLITITLAIITGGCASSSPPKLEANIQSVSFLNPNIYNQASPVVINIYQLKAPTTFQQANFFALYNNPTTTLATDLLDKRDIEIRPQQKQSIYILMSPTTNYIGVLAAFRDPDKAQWRQVIQVKPGKNIDLQINVATQSIAIKVK